MPCLNLTEVVQLRQLFLCCSRSDVSQSCSLCFGFPMQWCAQPLNSRCAVVKISPTSKLPLFRPNQQGELVVTLTMN